VAGLAPDSQQHPLAPDREFFAALRLDRAILGKVLRIGLPTGLQMVVLSLSELVILALVNQHGSQATAAYGAVTQIVNYVQFPALSIAITASILGAQAIGAGRLQRLAAILRTGLLINVCLTGGLIVLGYLLSHWLLGLFLTEDSTRAMAEHLLHIMLWSLLVFGFQAIIGGIMRASGGAGAGGNRHCLRGRRAVAGGLLAGRAVRFARACGWRFRWRIWACWCCRRCITNWSGSIRRSSGWSEPEPHRRTDDMAHSPVVCLSQSRPRRFALSGESHACPIHRCGTVYRPVRHDPRRPLNTIASTPPPARSASFTSNSATRCMAPSASSTRHCSSTATTSPTPTPRCTSTWPASMPAATTPIPNW
jgi:hypothetical protein